MTHTNQSCKDSVFPKCRTIFGTSSSARPRHKSTRDSYWQEHLQRRLDQNIPEPDSDLDERHEWACPFCESLFPTQAALKVHARRTHQHVDTEPVVFSRIEHALNGLPTCRFCNKNFSRWQTLAQHITQNRCTKYLPSRDIHSMESAPQENSPQASVAAPQPQQPPPAQPICQQETVVRAACKGLNSFIKCKDITARLQQTCAQCGQWVASHRTMKRHYQYTHPEVIQQLGSKAASLIQRTATACPTCHFCHVRCKD